MKPDYAAASTFESGNRVDRQRWFMTGLKRTMAEKGLELSFTASTPGGRHPTDGGRSPYSSWDWRHWMSCLPMS
jgi:hypothetical protein